MTRDWPPPPDVGNAGQILSDFWKQRYAAELQEAAEQRKVDDPERADSVTAGRTYDFAVRLEIVKAYLEVAKAVPMRVVTAAQFVQTAATAVGGLYTGLLTFSFKPTPEITVKLGLRALVPALFLGLAISLAASFLAFVTQGNQSEGVAGSGDPEIAQINRLNAFIAWSRELAYRRAYLLRAAVVSFGIGVALLPGPFIDHQLFREPYLLWLCVAGLVLVFLLPYLYALVAGGSAGFQTNLPSEKRRRK